MSVLTRPAGPPSRAWRRFALHAALAAGAFITIYPLLWMTGSSLKPENRIFSETSPVPGSPTTEHYREGWQAGGDFGTYFLNSLTISVLAVIGNVLACSMAAYAFARLDFRFRKLWFALMLATIMLPYHAVLIPQYFLFHELGWINSILPLVVPKFLATDAFFIFLMVQFIRSLPPELDQAAAVDGCNPLQIYLRVVFPLLRPALVTTAAFTFIWTYEDFFSQLIYLNDSSQYTVPLGLRMFLNSMGDSSYGQLFAMSVLTVVPVFVLFVIFQKHLVEGISTGSVKG
ncbi:Trehalose transport system permease protein SugB [Streptomyces sp. MP131-18]|nr:Trehalose transport system permease protein SugB [Streptomyces sp. MP131-18]